MTYIKTAELEGVALDWATGTAARIPFSTTPYFATKDSGGQEHGVCCWSEVTRRPWKPTADWSQGGPLVESYFVEISPSTKGDQLLWWQAQVWNPYATTIAHTPLVAACRAIVAAKLGDEVEIPDDLLGANT